MFPGPVKKLPFYDCLITFNNDGDKTLNLQYNLPEFITGCMIGKQVSLLKEDNTYLITDEHVLAGDKERFAREVVWYGRKGGKFLAPIKKMNTTLTEIIN